MTENGDILTSGGAVQGGGERRPVVVRMSLLGATNGGESA